MTLVLFAFAAAMMEVGFEFLNEKFCVCERDINFIFPLFFVFFGCRCRPVLLLASLQLVFRLKFSFQFVFVGVHSKGFFSGLSIYVKGCFGYRLPQYDHNESERVEKQRITPGN